MSVLANKIDFVAVVSATMANGNGDPLNGNRPRMNYDGLGEISDVCVKRKIRNRLQDLGHRVFVQSGDRSDDGCASLHDRFNAAGLNKIKDGDTLAATACAEFIDVRSFGQVFAFKNKKESGVSVGVRGPVSIHQATSVDPVEIVTMQITKSVNGETEKDGKKGSDTMGLKHMVKFGAYLIKGSINVQLAEKTGFTEEDACEIKEALRTLFVNDASSARPDGSMEVVKLFWFEHDCKDGSVSTARVHRAVKVVKKEGVSIPDSMEDYTICVDEIPGVSTEEIDGI